MSEEFLAPQLKGDYKFAGEWEAKWRNEGGRANEQTLGEQRHGVSKHTKAVFTELVPIRL